METLADIPLVGGTLAAIISFLIVLSVVVFVHEYGHYIVGRWCGIGAKVFSIGFGKPLFGWTDKRGTRWQVAALPLGGYVKFMGDMDPASAGRADDADLAPEERAASFHNARLWKRAATVFAGPAANFLLSILLFACLLLVTGRAANVPEIADIAPDAPAGIGFQAGDRVVAMDGEPVESFADVRMALHRSDGETIPAVVERDGRREEIQVQFQSPPRIDSISPGQPAARAGVAPGDVVLSMNGEDISSFYDLQVTTGTLEAGEEVTLTVRRGGEILNFTFTPTMMERINPATGEREPMPTLGVTSTASGALVPPREAVGPLEALGLGVGQTWHIASSTLIFLGDMVFANADTSQLGGPIRIAEISSERAQAGALELVNLIALLSTSIGLLNLLPIPVLDGGHLMFYAAEGLRGRPLGERWLQVGNAIGLSLVLFLMVFATYNDIARTLAG